MLCLPSAILHRCCISPSTSNRGRKKPFPILNKVAGCQTRLVKPYSTVYGLFGTESHLLDNDVDVSNYCNLYDLYL